MAVATTPHLRRWTRAEYERLIELGFFVGERVERIEGEIVEMTPMLSLHASTLGLVMAALMPYLGPDYILRPQMPLAFGPDAAGRDSDPEPDIAIVHGTWRMFVTSHPTTAMLVVEIADSSLNHDRTRKSRIYAQAGIPDYWSVNLVDRHIEILRGPTAGLSGREVWRYADQTIARAGDTISPLALPSAQIAVADMLP